MTAENAPSILDPCPTCEDKQVVFYETALRMVPCPTCRPGDHKEALRAL